MTYHCLDLFSGLGGFSQAFQESDLWRVTTVDIQERFQPDIQADVMTLRPTDLLDRGIDPDLVLASPPCTQFSMAASSLERIVDAEPRTPEAQDAVALVYHTIGLIKGLNPNYWYLENPTAYLQQIIGQPEGQITYCRYGRSYMKPTDLWGTHPPGFTYRKCSFGDPCHQTNTDQEHGGLGNCNHMGRTPAERAKVPKQLSQQIHDTVTQALQHTPPQQTTLTTAAPDGGDA